MATGKYYRGKDFKNLVRSSFYRITNYEEIHNGFEYKTGLNVDVLPFDPSGECKAGGLYFFDGSQVTNFKQYVPTGYWMRRVIIPDDAMVYIEKGKYKTNKFILREKIGIGNVDPKKLVNVHDECCKFLNEYGKFLNSNKNNSNNIERILKLNAYMLLKIDAPTSNMIIIALKQNPNVIRYIKNPSDVLSLDLRKQFGTILYNSEIQTEEICIEAVKQNGISLQYVKKSNRRNMS